MVAAGLIERDIMPGDRVALMLPTGSDFFVGFHRHPLRRRGAGADLSADAALADRGLRTPPGRDSPQCRRRMLITVPEALKLGALLQGLVGTLTSIESTTTLSAQRRRNPAAKSSEGLRNRADPVHVREHRRPQGVVLSHANLLANIRAIGRAVGATSADVFVSWLPLYHDMGLIGAWLGSLYFGGAALRHVAAALSRATAKLAVGDPSLPRHHSRRRRTSRSSCASTRLTDADLQDWTSSSLAPASATAPSRSASRRCGASSSVSRAYGFRPGAMAPVYGLAENAVAVTLPPPGRVPIIDRVDRTDAEHARDRRAGDGRTTRALSSSSPAASRFPTTRSASSTTAAARSANGERGGSSSAARRRPRATSRTRRRRASCSTTGGWTPVIAPTSRRRPLHHRPDQGHHHPSRPAHRST